MFFKNKYHEIRWNDSRNRTSIATLTIAIESIRPFKNSLFGTRNSDSAFDFVPDPMEIIGQVKSMEGMHIKQKEVLFLVPEEEVGPLKPGDSIMMRLSTTCYCYKFEKIIP